MILGVDVSKWQGLMNWAVTASRGVRRAYIRGAYGVEKDPYYTPNWASIGESGIKRAVTLYPLYALDFDKQLDYWLKLPNVEQGDYPPAVDIEFNAGEKKPDAAYAVKLLKLLYRMESEFGVKPVIYTGPAVIRAYLKLPEFGQYKLWIANYDARAPDVPSPWSPELWYGWQYSCKGDGKWYGASSKSIDLDVFRDEGQVTAPGDGSVPAHTHPDIVRLIVDWDLKQADVLRRVAALEIIKPGSAPFVWFVPNGGSAVIQHASKWYKTSGGVDKPIFAPVGSGTHPKVNGKARVFPLGVTGDGGQVCYMLLDQVIDGETVYVRRQDGEIKAGG